MVVAVAAAWPPAGAACYTERRWNGAGRLHPAWKGLTVAVLNVVLYVVLAITSLLLTLLILLHRGRGGGLSDMFGGGVTSSLGASGVAERNLNRITVVLGLVWFVTIVALGLILKFTGA
jgi:preprotein translocase subunit SecG